MKIKTPLFLFLLLFFTPLAYAEELKLPFSGRWFVGQGGDTLNVNHHMAVRSQMYGIDFIKVGGSSGRRIRKGKSNTPKDFFSWGALVLSPTSCTVMTVVDGFPDNPTGSFCIK